MASLKFRIVFKSSASEIITAAGYRADGPWIIFEDTDGEEVYRVNESEVRSLGRQDAAAAVGPFMA